MAGRSSRWQGCLIDGRVLIVFTVTFQVCNFFIAWTVWSHLSQFRRRPLEKSQFPYPHWWGARLHGGPTAVGNHVVCAPLNQEMDAHVEGVACTFAVQVAKDALHSHKETHGALKCAADIHCENEGLVDLVEFLDEMERKSQRQLCFEECEVCKHRRSKSQWAKNIYQCVRCNKRSNFGGSRDMLWVAVGARQV